MPGSMSSQKMVLLFFKVTAVVVIVGVTYSYLFSSGRVYVVYGLPAKDVAEGRAQSVGDPHLRDGPVFVRPPVPNQTGEEESSIDEVRYQLPPDELTGDVIGNAEQSDTDEMDAFNDYQPDDKEADASNGEHINSPETDVLDFKIHIGFNFPHPQVFLPTHTILSAQWVQQLKDHLRTIHPARSLTITVATKPFTPNLLNWLIATQLLVDPPMKHILVVGFDKDVHTLMAARNIPSIHVPMDSVIKGPRKGVSAVWMTRLAVIRLLNHWGYDVLQLDSDAVPLKNPQFLFNAYTDYDIVSARGILPFELGRGPWGFTLCMGAALLRATQKMELLWNAMHSPRMEKTTDDQKRINFALNRAKMQWESKEKYYDRANRGSSQDGVRVAVLPPKYVCRSTCLLNTTTDFFIWHQSGGGHSASWKSKQNYKSHVWFLSPDYLKKPPSSHITGIQWLRSLSLPDSIQNVRHRLSPTQSIIPLFS